MLFDDDFCLFSDGPLKGRRGQPRMWPPPELIEMQVYDEGATHMVVYRRHHYSAITDEQREGMTHVCRGAEYFEDADEEAKLTHSLEMDGGDDYTDFWQEQAAKMTEQGDV